MPQSRIFRIFLSSTFSDMKAERDALQARVFPKLQELCLQNGSRFQAIDLRWGVSDEAALDQKAVPICIAEIQRCQEVSPNLNFIVLLGNRYGWQPPSYSINADEFDAIFEHVPEADKSLLEQWYRRDDNAVPPEYILQVRENEYVEFENWSPVERELHSILLNAAKKSDISPEQRRKYHTSVTEQEIEEGIFNVVNAERTAYCFFRLSEDGEDGNAHIKQRLREQIPNNIDEYAEGDIDRLCDAVYERLSQAILEQTKSFETLTHLELENLAHEDFRRERVQNFIGRVDELEAMEAYLKQSNKTALAIYGQSGIGKSALMANAIEQARNAHPDAEIMYRFIGTSFTSSDARQLMGNLSSEIGRRYNQTVEIVSTAYNELGKQFQECLAFATSEKSLIIFLDALDQLTDINGRALNWLPATLPENVHLIVSTLPNECLTALKFKLPQNQLLQLQTMDTSDGETLLDLWLSEARRTLQPEQKKQVLDSFAECPLPLYLKLAFEEARLWRSYDEPVAFAPNISGLIEKNLFVRLADDRNHGELVVSRSLSYIAAAKDGVSEGEILDLLARDEVYFDELEMNSAKYGHTLPENRVPVVLWSRLYFDLAPYLTERGIGVTALMNFYHRQFSEAVRRQYLVADTKIERHVHLAYYFVEQPLQIAEDIPNLRTLSELPYQQSYGQLADEFVQTLTNFDFMQNKLDGLGVGELSNDYNYVERLSLESDKLRGLLLIQSAINMSNHILTEHTSSLAHQLVGRLMGYRNSNTTILEFTNQVSQQPKNLFPLHLDKDYITHKQANSDLEHTLKGHDKAIDSVEITPDDQYIISISYYDSIRIWDLHTGSLINSIDENTISEDVEVVTPNGRYSVSSSGKSVVQIRDLHTSEELTKYTKRTITPNGHYSISVDRDTINVHDLQTDILKYTFRGHPVEIWDPTLQIIQSEKHIISAIAVTPNSQYLASASNDCTIKVWDLNAGTLKHTLSGHIDPVNTIAVTSDGKYVISGSDDCTVKIWDINTGTLKHTYFGHSDKVTEVFVTSDGQRIISVSGLFDNTIKIWILDVEKNTTSGYETGSRVNDIAITPEGKYAICATGSPYSSVYPALSIWDLDTLKKETQSLLGHTKWVRAVAVTPDGQFAISSSFDQTVKIWDLNTTLEMQSHSWRGVIEVDAIAITPDGQFAVLAPSHFSSQKRLLKIWNWHNGKEKWSQTGHRGSVLAIAISHNGRFAVTAANVPDRTIKVWNLNTLKEHKTLVGHDDSVNTIAITFDNKYIISGSSDHTIKIWELQTGNLIQTIMAHSSYINAVIVSPDNRFFISASEDNTLRVWDVDSKECLAIYIAEDRLRSCAMSPDGRVLIAGGGSGHLHFLRLEGLEIDQSSVEYYAVRNKELASKAQKSWWQFWK